jgi:hypothetical protein
VEKASNVSAGTIAPQRAADGRFRHALFHAIPDWVLQIFADAKQPGHQGVLEVVSFLVVIAILFAELVGGVIILFAA